MSDTQTRFTRAPALLQEDHRRVEKLFEEYEQLGERACAARARVFKQVRLKLTVHAQIEEEIFYPAVTPADLQQRGFEDHGVIRRLLSELGGLAPSDPAFPVKMQALRDLVERHVREEEDDVLPLFENLSEGEQERLSHDLWRRRLELKHRHAG